MVEPAHVPVPATADHVEDVTAKQTVDLKTSSFYKTLATIGSFVVGIVLLALQNYATTARTNPTDDAQTLAVKVLQEQMTALIGRLAVQPAPVVAPPVAPPPAVEAPAIKLWQPGPSGQAGDGTWVSGRVVGPWEKK